MYKVLLALVLAVFNIPLFAPVVDLTPTLLQDQHRAAHHIEYDNALEGDSCSATAVGPHTLLTAGHCLMASTKIIIDGTPTVVKNMVFDDADHMLVITDATFPAFLAIDQKALGEAGQVHMWGNPGHSVDVYRIGAFLKWEDDGDTKLAVFQLPVFAGDSGSGIINDAGLIIGVVSMGDKNAQTAVLPFAFTPEQLAEIK
jgi:hypothetical protein